METKAKKQIETFIRSKIKKHKEKEIKAILDIFKERNYSKGDIFKKNNTIAKEIAFIIEGAARMYILKDNGDDITVRIFQSDNFMTEFMSARTNEALPIAIEFLEPSEILVASLEDARRLLEDNLTFNILFREYLSDSIVQAGKRHLLFLTGTAKERYQFILENNPRLLKKFPLRIIASMIGITPTQLSRIRNKK